MDESRNLQYLKLLSSLPSLPQAGFKADVLEKAECCVLSIIVNCRVLHYMNCLLHKNLYDLLPKSMSHH